MGHIAFSLSGEGRGHATRVRAIVEAVRKEHRVTLLASGDAYSFLSPHYRGTDVSLHRIGGLRFHYTPRRRLDFSRTLYEAARFARRLPLLVRMVKRRLTNGGVDLLVADFEPAGPRAARKLGLPFLSIDHQHFLTCYDLASLPRFLRWRAWVMGWAVSAYCQGQRETVVSAFFFPPVRRGRTDVTQAGVMLRPEVLAAEPTDRGHLVAYWRRFASDAAMAALRDCGREVRIYGLGARPSAGNLVFREIHEHRFLEDLASASALVSTAGNQLVGEALHLGKPVFAMPEARNFEQYINAVFLAQAGGEWTELEKVTASQLTGFLSRLEAHRSRIDRSRMHGLPTALSVIGRNLPSTSAVKNVTAPRPRVPVSP